MSKPRNTIDEIVEHIVKAFNPILNGSYSRDTLRTIIEANRYGIYEQVQYDYDCADVRSILAERGFFFVKEEYIDAIIHELQSGYDSTISLWDNISNAIDRVQYFWNIGLLTDIQNFDEAAATRAIADYLIRVHADECTDDMDEEMLQALKTMNCNPNCPQALSELTQEAYSSENPLAEDKFMDALYNYLKENK